MDGVITVELFGGPLDGQRMTLPDEQVRPRTFVWVETAPSMHGLLESRADAVVVPGVLAYRRGPMPRPDGVWVYRLGQDLQA